MDLPKLGVGKRFTLPCPVGSADYIAPEYLLGETGSHVSDIFSLGVIVYEMLIGKLPMAICRACMLRSSACGMAFGSRTSIQKTAPW